MNVAQVKQITRVCLFMKSRCVVAFPQLVCTWQAEKRFMRRWSVSFSISSSQTPHSWECDGIDQANSWQVYVGTSVHQIKKYWKHCGNYSLGSL